MAAMAQQQQRAQARTAGLCARPGAAGRWLGDVSLGRVGAGGVLKSDAFSSMPGHREGEVKLSQDGLPRC